MTGTSHAFKSRLLMAKETRKAAEQDAQILANRIALLKLENERAWKKIEQTKKRAEELSRAKAEAEAKEREKQAREADARKAERKRLAKTATSPADRRKAASRSKLAMHEAKVDKARGAEELKEEKRRMWAAKAAEEKTSAAEARKRSEAIRGAELLARKRREDERKRAIAMRRAEYEAKIEAERAEAERVQKRLAELARVEEQMISRLRDTQILQQREIAALEGMLTGPPAAAAAVDGAVEEGSFVSAGVLLVPNSGSRAGTAGSRRGGDPRRRSAAGARTGGSGSARNGSSRNGSARNEAGSARDKRRVAPDAYGSAQRRGGPRRSSRGRGESLRMAARSGLGAGGSSTASLTAASLM